LSIGCLSGTREDEISIIRRWSEDFSTSSNNIFWLKGGPGSGKTSIIRSLITEAQHHQRFGAVFTFQQRTGARSLWQSIAFDITYLHPALRRNVLKTLESVDDVKKLSIAETFKSLILNPLKAASAFFSSRTLLFVIDGLDQLPRDRQERRNILETLSQWSELPSNYKLLISSWQLPDVSLSLTCSPPPKELDLDDRTTNGEDIRKYIRHRLQMMRTDKTSDAWPSDRAVTFLTTLASGLFFWAAARLNDVAKDSDRERQLAALLSERHRVVCKEMDNYYTHVIRNCVATFSESQPWPKVVVPIILAKRHFVSSDLAEFLELDGSVVQKTLDKLSPIIINDGSGARFRHRSVAIHWFDPGRAEADYAIENEEAKRNMAYYCLRNMRTKLRFNYFNITSSHTVQLDLRTRVPESLSYSCQFWAIHLLDSPTQADEKLIEVLEEFLQELLFSWLEILSVLGTIESAPQLLGFAEVWLQVTKNLLRRGLTLMRL
jgi:hypothetical protein